MKQIIRVIRVGNADHTGQKMIYCVDYSEPQKDTFDTLEEAWKVFKYLKQYFPENTYTVVIEQEPPKPSYQYVVKLLNTQMFVTPIHYDSEEKVMENYKNDRVEWLQRIENTIKEF